MEKPKFKKSLKIIIIIFLILIILIGGYFGYQLFLVPKITKLPPPASYPYYSVIYNFAILGSKGTMINIGDKWVPQFQVTNIVKSDMKKIKEAGFGGIKLNFYFQSDFYNYLVNRIALHAVKYGLYPIGLLHGNPSRPKNQPFSKEEMKQWQKYVREQVRKNKNLIYFWEIWNEPGLDLFKYGSPEEFVELLKNTSPIIKEENPQAKIIVTLSAEGNDETGFEEAVIKLGGGDYFDILSFHPYGGNPFLQEDLIEKSIAKEKSVIKKYNNRWLLVITEIGQPASQVSEEEQARLAKFVYTKAKENNIPLTWYYWSDEFLPKNYKPPEWSGSNWGLIRHDGTERPVFQVIKEFLKLY